jgi:hypothetical protein
LWVAATAAICASRYVGAMPRLSNPARSAAIHSVAARSKGESSVEQALAVGLELIAPLGSGAPRYPRGILPSRGTRGPIELPTHETGRNSAVRLRLCGLTEGVGINQEEHLSSSRRGKFEVPRSRQLRIPPKPGQRSSPRRPRFQNMPGRCEAA